MLDPDLRVDEDKPIFEGNTYDLKMILYSDRNLTTRENITGASWISCALYDDKDPTKDKVQVNLAGGITKTDASNGEALATFSTVQTTGFLRAGQRSRTLRYEWIVVMNGKTQTVRWGFIKVFPSGGAS